MGQWYIIDCHLPGSGNKQTTSAPRQHFSESSLPNDPRQENMASSVGWGAVLRPLKRSQLSDHQEYMWEKNRTLWFRLARKTQLKNIPTWVSHSIKIFSPDVAYSFRRDRNIKAIQYCEEKLWAGIWLPYWVTLFSRWSSRVKGAYLL